MTEWETVERPPLPEIFDVREEPLVGIYVESHTARVKDNFGTSPDGKRDAVIHVFHYQDATGKLVGVFGKPDLDGKMSQVQPGDLVRIEFLGLETQDNGRKLARFDVKRAAGAMPPASSRADGDNAAQDGDEDIPF